MRTTSIVLDANLSDDDFAKRVQGAFLDGSAECKSEVHTTAAARDRSDGRKSLRLFAPRSVN